MQKDRKLFVFEGPDGVGKSTLSRMLADYLQSSGAIVRHLSFPGRDEGTLGRLVYRLHHQPSLLGIAAVSPASRQALHIAAHLDAIEGIILPALENGECVILDRFWWSTWVYGIVDGLSKDLLEGLLQAERVQWAGVLPTMMFLVQSERSFRADEPTRKWRALAEAYRELAGEERRKYPVHFLRNNASLEESFQKVLASIEDHISEDHV